MHQGRAVYTGHGCKLQNCECFYSGVDWFREVAGVCGALENAAVMMFHFYLNVNVELRTHLDFMPKSALSRNFCMFFKNKYFLYTKLKGKCTLKITRMAVFFVCVV